ncbi:MAG: hypothetical protein IIZ63_11875 [Caulobacteraceae bacterium]|nr:hypothetical protein [Caulobacteraceae bacterium]
MILHLSPQAPLALRLVADATLFTHIAAGVAGLVSGAVAMAARKGGRLHRRAGGVFVVSMLTMATIGGAVAALFPTRLSVVVAVLTLYLVTTGWRTLRRPDGTPAAFDRAATVVAASVALAALAFGLMAARAPSGDLDGLPAGPHFAFAGVAALAAGLDLKVMLAGGAAGAARLSRHLWRMSAALLIASTSFFQGQAQVFPKALQDSPLLAAPDVAIIALMVFWLLRVNFGRRFKARAGEEASPAARPLSR